MQRLPIVYVCENNLYMEYTPIGEVTAVADPAAGRASAYGLESIVIDGQDADIVYRTAREAYAKARAGESQQNGHAPHFKSRDLRGLNKEVGKFYFFEFNSSLTIASTTGFRISRVTA